MNAPRFILDIKNLEDPDVAAERKQKTAEFWSAGVQLETASSSLAGICGRQLIDHNEPELSIERLEHARSDYRAKLEQITGEPAETIRRRLNL